MHFIEFDTTVIRNKLVTLEPSVKPLWGTMTAHQMVEHLSHIMKISIGEIKVDLETPEDKLERAHSFLMSDHPMPKEFKAKWIPDKEFLPKKANLAAAIDELIKLMDKFEQVHQNNTERFIHPVFGNLDGEEWEWLHRKHFTHHFTQFNLI